MNKNIKFEIKDKLGHIYKEDMPLKDFQQFVYCNHSQYTFLIMKVYKNG